VADEPLDGRDGEYIEEPAADEQGPLPRCTVCGRSKKPMGRSSPLEMSLCDDDCGGYRESPEPTCRWPGETTCGPGCPWGDEELRNGR
jgi:hypothetical protein